ncbi:MAG: heat-inducible transcriptional repressor HrcA [Gemmatimonadota bacterium]
MRSAKVYGRQDLTERERAVLTAVIDSFVRTASPAGSRRLSREYDLGVSPATIRNTMADLETKGFLSHPHTSAGRMPTDLAYRYYVDALMGQRRIAPGQRAKIEKELASPQHSAIEELMSRAAQVLGLLTGELGLAVGPALASAVLRRLELVPVNSEKALLVLTLESGVVRTVFVDLPTALPRNTLAAVAAALNERLAGTTLEEVGEGLGDRLRDLSVGGRGVGDLINIFVQSGPEIFDWAGRNREVHLGSASVLADQPEFNSEASLKSLIELTEKRQLLASILGDREASEGPQITIGAEHAAPELEALTIVTASYCVGNLQGVVGVMGPTRMAYDKVIAIVDCTSALVSKLARA